MAVFSYTKTQSQQTEVDIEEEIVYDDQSSNGIISYSSENADSDQWSKI